MTNNFIDILQLIAGIVLLMLSGDYLIKGGVSIANRFKISNLVIGLTVVAFGTSAPELIVSMDAAFTNHPEIALGNVIGSNIANIALVLAITVIILPMPVAGSTIKRSLPVMLVSAAAMYLTMLDNVISNWEGVLLFMLLLLFIYDSIRYNKKHQDLAKMDFPQPKYKTWLAILIVVLASGGLAFGSRLLINGASGIASQLGVTERIISLTIVAFGTSVPELTASVIAAIKKESDISAGNIIGSNIFNVFAVIGLTSAFKKIEFSFADFHVDLIFMLLISLALAVFVLPWKTMWSTQNGRRTFSLSRISGGKMSRLSGIIFIVVYLVYLYSIIK